MINEPISSRKSVTLSVVQPKIVNFTATPQRIDMDTFIRMDTQGYANNLGGGISGIDYPTAFFTFGT